MATLDFIPTQQLLELPTAPPRFSKQFAEFCLNQEWLTLRDVLNQPLSLLLEIPGYRADCHDELVAFLASHHRLHLVDTGG